MSSRAYHRVRLHDSHDLIWGYLHNAVSSFFAAVDAVWCHLAIVWDWVWATPFGGSNDQ